jgi:(hydroxyamino)benzene mutase
VVPGVETSGKLTPRELAGRQLLRFGVVLFLLGLLTGLAVPATANPRMALASHVEGLMNGMFLLLLGLLWPKLVLSPRALTLAFWFMVYGAYANWFATILAAILPAGAALMPLAGQGHSGSAAEEAVVKVLLVSLSILMIAGCGIVLVGLRRPAES